MKSRAALIALIAVLFSVGLGIAVVAGFSVASRPARREPAQVAATRPEEGIGVLIEYDSRLRRLDQALEQERGRRVALEAEVAELRRRIDERHRRLHPSATSGAHASRAAETEGGVRAGSAHGRIGIRGASTCRRSSRPASLAAKVRAFKEKLDQIELDRLYLRDLAAREGWLDTPRFREEDSVSATWPSSTRRWATSSTTGCCTRAAHPNRVRIGEVLGGSAAAAAGLRPGDLILSYDEQRIFNPGELRDSTTTGTAGDTTPVWVMRGGQEIQVFVPRGPLGIRVGSATERPPRAS